MGRNGLVNVIDVVVAPESAFGRLRVVPTWGWTFLVATLLGIAGMLLMLPAQTHAFEKSAPAMYAALPQIAKLPPDQQATRVNAAVKAGRTVIQLSWLAVPVTLLLGALIQSIVMLVANAIVRGDGSFARYWALSVATALISVGFGLLLTGLIATLRGPDAFSTTADVQRALPGLGLLAPGANPKLGAFLGAFNVTAIWAAVLTALGMRTVGRVATIPAAVTAALLLLVSATFVALFTPASS